MADRLPSMKDLRDILPIACATNKNIKYFITKVSLIKKIRKDASRCSNPYAIHRKHQRSITVDALNYTAQINEITSLLNRISSIMLKSILALPTNATITNHPLFTEDFISLLIHVLNKFVKSEEMDQISPLNDLCATLESLINQSAQFDETINFLRKTINKFQECLQAMPNVTAAAESTEDFNSLTTDILHKLHKSEEIKVLIYY